MCYRPPFLQSQQISGSLGVGSAYDVKRNKQRTQDPCWFWNMRLLELTRHLHTDGAKITFARLVKSDYRCASLA